MYEGAPDYPHKGIWWELIARYGVTIFYTAPTAIRACMAWGEEWPAKYNLSSLRLLGTVGEPINPKAWLWYHTVIGGERCPIVDTWWQTETGSIMIAPLPGVVATKPGSATRPLPGVSAALFDSNGHELQHGSGLLVLTEPWPSMLRTLYGDAERYVQTYFSQFGPQVYVVGDAARLDSDGYFWIVGRTDDVINVSGHRLSTAEVESAIVAHEKVAEAAVYQSPTSSPVRPSSRSSPWPAASRGTRQPRLRSATTWRGASAGSPGPSGSSGPATSKTRSGKIMRRLLRDIAEGRELGDVTTLPARPLLQHSRRRSPPDPMTPRWPKRPPRKDSRARTDLQSIDRPVVRPRRTAARKWRWAPVRSDLEAPRRAGGRAIQLFSKIE